MRNALGENASFKAFGAARHVWLHGMRRCWLVRLGERTRCGAEPSRAQPPPGRSVGRPAPPLRGQRHPNPAREGTRWGYGGARRTDRAGKRCAVCVVSRASAPQQMRPCPFLLGPNRCSVETKSETSWSADRAATFFGAVYFHDVGPRTRCRTRWLWTRRRSRVVSPEEAGVNPSPFTQGFAAGLAREDGSR